MLSEALPEDYRAGFVALAGRPNVGKSTLMNALLGQKVAAVSPRPQTTRKRQLGILTTERGQIVFVDTPGIHKAHHKLGEALNYEALTTWEDVDLILFMVDGAYPPHEEDRLVARYIRETAADLPVLIVFNKVDQTPKDRVEAYQAMYQELLPDAPLIAISALTGEGLDALLDAIFERLPVSPPYYDEDTITDLTEREIAADLIREAALMHLRDEVWPCALTNTRNAATTARTSRPRCSWNVIRKRALSLGKGAQCSSKSAPPRGRPLRP